MTDGTTATASRTGAVGLVRAVVDGARERDVTFLAAAVAYYAFVSLVPLALLAFAVATLVGGEALTRAVRGVASGLLADAGEQVLFEALEGEAGRGGATVGSLAVLVWSSLRLFRGLDSAFSRVYGSREPSLLGQFLDALIVLGAVALALVAMTVAGVVIQLFPGLPAVRSAGAVALWLTLSVALLPLYYLLPDVDVSVRESLPGAAFAGGAFVVLGTLFGYYAAVAGNYAVYGVLGAVLLLVTWLYVGSTAVMVGAVLNAVLAGRIENWSA